MGVEPSSVSRISAHSACICAAQDLIAAGGALPEIVIAGAWRSPQMPAHYARKLDARGGAMRRWLETARKDRNPVTDKPWEPFHYAPWVDQADALRRARSDAARTLDLT